MPEPAIEQRLRELCGVIPVCRTLGFELLSAADGRCRIRVPHDHAFDGVDPNYHGGLLTTVADSVAWFAIMSRTGLQGVFTTSDLHVRFLAPCRGDVTADARVIKLGRTLCPVHVDLADPAGRLVAVAQVAYFRLAEPPPGP